MTDKERIAQHSDAVLKDEAVIEAFRRIEEQAFEAIMRCDHADNDGRLAQVYKIQAVRALKSELSTLITLAKVEAKNSPRQGS